MRLQKQSVVLAVAVASVTLVDSARAALPIFAAPGYDPATGVAVGLVQMPAVPGHSVAEGYACESATFAAGAAFKTGVVRWNAFGLANDAMYGSAGGAFSTPSVYSARGMSNTARVVAKFTTDTGYTYGQRLFIAGANVVGDLNPLPRTDSLSSGLTRDMSPTAINASSTAVGYSKLLERASNQDVDRGLRAVRWDPTSSAAINLGSPSIVNGVGNSQAIAIADNGVITGSYTQYGLDGEDLGTRGVRWTAGSATPTPLGTFGTNLSGVTQVAINTTNATGATAGSAWQATSTSPGSQPAVAAPTRWSATSTMAQALGTLSGSGTRTVAGAVTDMSDTNACVGWSHKGFSTTDKGERAARWTATGSTAAIELATLSTNLSGYAIDRATATNNLGGIVGTAERYNGDTLAGTSAVLWRADGSVVDLNTLVADPAWHFDTAVDLSECGFVSGLGTYTATMNGSPYRYTRGYMLLIPELGTYGKGDANFDKVVNFDDLVVLAQNYNLPNASKSVTVGDFNLDGVVNFDDLVPLAQNYNKTLSAGLLTADASFAADWALAQSLVPEPGVVALIGLAALATRRR